MTTWIWCSSADRRRRVSAAGSPTHPSHLLCMSLPPHLALQSHISAWSGLWEASDGTQREPGQPCSSTLPAVTLDPRWGIMGWLCTLRSPSGWLGPVFPHFSSASTLIKTHCRWNSLAVLGSPGVWSRVQGWLFCFIFNFRYHWTGCADRDSSLPVHVSRGKSHPHLLVQSECWQHLNLVPAYAWAGSQAPHLWCLHQGQWSPSPVQQPGTPSPSAAWSLRTLVYHCYQHGNWCPMVIQRVRKSSWDHWCSFSHISGKGM